MIKYSFRLELDEAAMADIMEMAEHVGRPGDRTAGLCAIIADWRRFKHAATLARREEFLNSPLGGIQRHEEYCDAQDRHDEATA